METLTLEDYRIVAKRICDLFNGTFGTNYIVSIKSSDEVKKENPNLKIDYEKSGGFYNSNKKEVIIFYDVLIKLNKLMVDRNSKKDISLTYLIFSVFHELNHRIQFERKDELKAIVVQNSSGSGKIEEFYKFMIEVELMSIGDLYLGENFYINHHDNILIEIDSDIKGIRNALFFADSIKNPPLDEDYYKYFNFYNEFRLASYDSQAFIERLNKFILLYPGITNKLNKKFSNLAIYEFFTSDGKYRSVGEIMRNPLIQKCDFKIVSSIMSSTYFINMIDIVSNEERNFLLKCMLETYKRYVESCTRREKDLVKAQYSLDYIEKAVGRDEMNRSQKNLDSLADTDYYALLRAKLEQYGYIQQTGIVQKI